MNPRKANDVDIKLTKDQAMFIAMLSAEIYEKAAKESDDICIGFAAEVADSLIDLLFIEPPGCLASLYNEVNDVNQPVGEIQRREDAAWNAAVEACALYLQDAATHLQNVGGASEPSRFERNATAKRYNSMAEFMRTLKLPNSGNDEPKEGEVVNQPSHTQQTYTVKIRCNDTGEVVNYHVSQEWDDEITLFLWTEGNWSCDCNRQRFFFLAKGIDAPTNITCSDGKYTVIKSMLPDGRTIKID